MNNVVILGAGLSGLLASYKIRSQGIKDVTVFEKNSGIRHLNSTAAFYCHRFLNKELTPDYKKFSVTWRIKNGSVDLVRNQRDYAMKVYGNLYQKVSIKSAVTTGWWLDAQRLVDLAHINFDSKINKINIAKKCVWVGSEKFSYDILISTIPLPFFINKAELQLKFDFGSLPIYISTEKSSFQHSSSAMIIEYFPKLNVPYYRRTHFNGKTTIESVVTIPESIPTFPGKILFIPPEQMKRFNDFVETMRMHKVYFAGRYARWEPKHLIHETFYNIIREINNEI